MKRRFLLLAPAVIVLILDRAAKLLILHYIPLNDEIAVISPVFKITNVRNTGAAFGLFQGYPLFFTVLTAGAIAVIIVHFLSTVETGRLYLGALSLVLGGAGGNLIDRLLHGYVVDFVDIGLGTARWPSFNIADAAISTGVLILVFQAFLPSGAEANSPEGES